MSAEQPYKIASTQAVVGDWFLLWAPKGDGDRWFIERVVLWALVESEGHYPHIKAIGAHGLALPPEGMGNGYWFVFGSDNSPMGPTWGEIFKSAEQRVTDPCREITNTVSKFLASELLPPTVQQ
jgi:hypothetical protein